jgi:hypothetical protein
MRLANRIFTTLIFLLITSLTFSPGLNEEEKKLYNLMMEYRKKNGLPSIPQSVSLTFVAQAHVHDLNDNHPDLTTNS